MLTLAFPSKSEEAISVKSQCLESATGWMRMNKLKLNSDKTEVLMISQKADLRIGIQIGLVLHSSGAAG